MRARLVSQFETAYKLQLITICILRMLVIS